MIEPKIKTIAEVEGISISRVLNVKIKGFRNIETPSRAATRTQLNSKRYAPTGSTLDNDIIIIDFPIVMKDFSEREFNAFFRRKLLELELLYGDLHSLHYLIPYFYPVGKTRKKLANNVRILKKIYIEALILALASLGGTYRVGSVLIPPLNLEFSAYKEILKQISKNLERYDIQVIPVIDMEYNNFRRILLFITEELGMNVVGLKYKKIRNVLGNYLLLRELYMDKDILLIITDVPRESNEANIPDFATAHLMNFVGVDIVSTKLSRGPQPVQSNVKKIKPNFRLLDRKELRLPLITKLSREKVTELFYDAGITKEDPKVNDVVEVLSDKQKLLAKIDSIRKRIKSKDKMKQRRAREELRRMYSITVFQEIKASTKEFGILRYSIIRDELIEYLEKKKNLKKVIITILQKKLIK